MGIAATVLTKTNTGMNKVMKPWLRSPRFHRLISRRLALISYTGRRSGSTFSTPVAYQRKGDLVTIRVALPDHKAWWRNFQGDGAPIRLKLRGVDHSGHAKVERGAKGQVSVRVELAD